MNNNYTNNLYVRSALDSVMQLRDALDDYKRFRTDERRLPGERRTTRGRFSGDEGRLVHVSPDGSIRDFGYPLSGLTGITRSRFGIHVAGQTRWFTAQKDTQRYVADSSIVETTHNTCVGTVVQRDFTAGGCHLTGFELDVDPTLAGPIVDSIKLVAAVSLSPDGRDTRIGTLTHEAAIEVYHGTEHDFFASATAVESVRGQVPGVFEEILAEAPMEYPLPPADGRYEEDKLSGDLVCHVPLESGSTVIGTLLTDQTETDREAAVTQLAEQVKSGQARLFDPDHREAAQIAGGTTGATAQSELVREDLHVLSLLSAPSGLRIAGPDFDPYYVHSGGYGYTWFRDDAEISRFLLDADDRLELGLDSWHERSARAYCRTQREDGSWPHRVWPRDGSLAPGWANARLEAGTDDDYQADQTASVISFLASYRGQIDDRTLREQVDSTLRDAVDSLDDTLKTDGLPMVCQNAWEDTTGRFGHTAATFLEAYSTLAATDLSIADHAAMQADRVYEAIDRLWVPERGQYAMRECQSPVRSAGTWLDPRADSATLALAGAHQSYAAIGTVDDQRLDRLVAHMEAIVDRLYRDPDGTPIEGLVRYEGDDWRTGEQAGEKIWTVSTAWGANAAAQLAVLLGSDPRAEEMDALARQLLALIRPDGPLCAPTGYLPEQFFDDGTPDSATPLGWPHALRTATAVLLRESATTTGIATGE